MGVRGPKRSAHIWSGRHSPWKMWPPVSPMRCFDVGWAEHLAVHDHLGHVGREAADGRDGEIADLLASLVPCPDGELERDVLREDAHDVTDPRGPPTGRRRSGSRARTTPGPARPVGSPRRPTAWRRPGADGDHGPVRVDVGPRRGETGQPAERAVDLQHRARRCATLPPAGERRRGRRARTGPRSVSDRRWTPRPGLGSSPRLRARRPRRAARRRPARPAATTAPASMAASASANDTCPMPPSTYPHAPARPSRVPEACMRWTPAVPGSRGPAQVPMIP